MIGQVIFSYESEAVSFTHELRHPEHLPATDDALFRIAILSRPANDINYSITGVIPNSGSVDFFEKAYNCTITTPTRPIPDNAPSKILADDVYLCFSGGFDSIAAKAILPASTHLISNEFGGAFEREALFFKQFHTQILQWDLRRARPEGKMKFNESIDWRFMLAPGLLFKKRKQTYRLSNGHNIRGKSFLVLWQCETRISELF